jgi:hypothetical protein
MNSETNLDDKLRATKCGSCWGECGKCALDELREETEATARRTPPAEVSADGMPVLSKELPPLPPATEGTVTGARRWSASRMWEYADQAIAPYAEQIKKLERENKDLKLQIIADIGQESELAERKQVQSIGEDKKFHLLLNVVCDASEEMEKAEGNNVFSASHKLEVAKNCLITYIDARTGTGESK